MTLAIKLFFLLMIGSTLSNWPSVYGYPNFAKDHCGVRQVINRDGKIVGGHSTYHGQYPWAASLRIKHANNRHHCGGALIDRQWILTAAHCVASFSPTSFVVRLGGHRRASLPETGAQDVNVKQMASHEGFTFATFYNDIALVKLERPIEYNRFIQPICLPGDMPESLINKKGMVIGWGRLSQSGTSPNTLMQVELPILDSNVCQGWYQDQGRFISLGQSQFCAGFEQGKSMVPLTNGFLYGYKNDKHKSVFSGQDACQGDSGGPMMIHNATTGQSVVIGVVSAGIGCALYKLPGLYTNVSMFTGWIRDTMTRLGP